eukprot:g4998.t1
MLPPASVLRDAKKIMATKADGRLRLYAHFHCDEWRPTRCGGHMSTKNAVDVRLSKVLPPGAQLILWSLTGSVKDAWVSEGKERHHRDGTRVDRGKEKSEAHAAEEGHRVVASPLFEVVHVEEVRNAKRATRKFNVVHVDPRDVNVPFRLKDCQIRPHDGHETRDTKTSSNSVLEDWRSLRGALRRNPKLASLIRQRLIHAGVGLYEEKTDDHGRVKCVTFDTLMVVFGDLYWILNNNGGGASGGGNGDNIDGGRSGCFVAGSTRWKRIFRDGLDAWPIRDDNLRQNREHAGCPPAFASVPFAKYLCVSSQEAATEATAAAAAAVVISGASQEESVVGDKASYTKRHEHWLETESVFASRRKETDSRRLFSTPRLFVHALQHDMRLMRLDRFVDDAKEIEGIVEALLEPSPGKGEMDVGPSTYEHLVELFEVLCASRRTFGVMSRNDFLSFASNDLRICDNGLVIRSSEIDTVFNQANGDFGVNDGVSCSREFMVRHEFVLGIVLLALRVERRRRRGSGSRTGTKNANDDVEDTEEESDDADAVSPSSHNSPTPAPRSPSEDVRVFVERSLDPSLERKRGELLRDVDIHVDPDVFRREEVYAPSTHAFVEKHMNALGRLFCLYRDDLEGEDQTWSRMRRRWRRRFRCRRTKETFKEDRKRKSAAAANDDLVFQRLSREVRVGRVKDAKMSVCERGLIGMLRDANILSKARKSCEEDPFRLDQVFIAAAQSVPFCVRAHKGGPRVLSFHDFVECLCRVAYMFADDEDERPVALKLAELYQKHLSRLVRPSDYAERARARAVLAKDDRANACVRALQLRRFRRQPPWPRESLTFLFDRDTGSTVTGTRYGFLHDGAFELHGRTFLHMPRRLYGYDAHLGGGDNDDGGGNGAAEKKNVESFSVPTESLLGYTREQHFTVRNKLTWKNSPISSKEKQHQCAYFALETEDDTTAYLESANDKTLDRNGGLPGQRVRRRRPNRNTSVVVIARTRASIVRLTS